MKRIFGITDYGAQPGSQTLQTGAIQKAIDECFLSGGGEVQIPAGIFRTGGILLRSNCTLHLLENAVLAGSRDPGDYFGYLGDKLEPLPEDKIKGTQKNSPGIASDCSRWNNALIRALYAENIAILGEPGSAIDGSDCFDETGEEHYRGPHAVTFRSCRGITFRGYTIRNASNWAHNLYDCGNILMESVRVLAGHDGAHFRGCENIIVRNCGFYTGDDCVAGFANVNLLLQDSILNTACSGMRFGGTNARIERCRFTGPAKYLFRGSLSSEEKRSGAPSAAFETDKTPGHRYNMLSAFTYFSDYTRDVPVQPGNIVLSGCVIENNDRFLHYNFSGNEPWQKNRPLENITFENIRATGIRLPLNAYASPDVPFTLTIRGTEVSFAENAAPDSFIRAAYCRRIELENVRITGFTGNTLIRKWHHNGEILLQNVECASLAVMDADEPFVTQAI